MKTYKGRFIPKNPKKYSGDPTNIIFRSSWELKVFKYLDENTNILEWSSEELFVPYVSPVDNRVHRYFPDVVVKMRLPDNTIKTMMLEVKPASQTKEPEIPSRRTRKFVTEVLTWSVNQAKWKSATEYCADRGWEFKLITEHNLFGKTK